MGPGPGSLLVVDDNEMNRDLDSLRSLGMTSVDGWAINLTSAGGATPEPLEIRGLYKYLKRSQILAVSA